MSKDEALKLALEVMHNQGDVGVDEWIAAEAAIKQALAAQPAPVPDLTHDQWDKWQDKHSLILERDALDELRAMLNTPPAAAVQEGRDWSLLEATQESLREHMAEIKRLKEAQPAVQEPVAWAGHNLDDMCEAFDRVIEEHASRKNPFHDPVNKDAMIALRILRGFVPHMKRYTAPPAAAVPDAIGPNEDELPAYAAGWNDCRQAMLEMMK